MLFNLRVLLENRVTVLAKPEVFSRLSSSVEGWRDDCLLKVTEPTLRVQIQLHVAVSKLTYTTIFDSHTLNQVSSEPVAHFSMLWHEHICGPHWPSEANITKTRVLGSATDLNYYSGAVTVSTFRSSEGIRLSNVWDVYLGSLCLGTDNKRENIYLKI